MSLINDILDLSKIEAGRMGLAPAPFHLPSTRLGRALEPGSMNELRDGLIRPFNATREGRLGPYRTSRFTGLTSG